jgi:hypothetical protein
MPHIMSFGILKAQLSVFVATRIQIGPVTRMIGNQPPGLANFLAGPWCVGHLRRKIAYLSLVPKSNMLPPQADALNCYG